MADQLSPKEELAAKEFISLVNASRASRGSGPLAWNTALQFLMARKWDVKRAFTLYQQHEITRTREGLTAFMPHIPPLRTELETGKFTVLPTRDTNGAAIAVFTARLHYPQLTSHQTTLQGVVYQLDVALESTETQRSGLVFIYDMTDSKYANFDYELSQKILTLLKGAYPARLKKVLIVTAPLWFKAPFKILRLFVREKLRDRVFTVSLPQLPLHLPLESLPTDLRGHFKVDHAAWLRHCFKSMTNKLGDLCDVSSPPPPPPEEEEEEGDAAEEGESEDEGEEEEEEDGENLKEVIETPEVGTLIYVNQNATPLVTSELSTHILTVMGQEGPVGSLDRASPPPPPSSASSGFSDDDSLHYDDGRGLSLQEFAEHVSKKGRKDLYEEYAIIKSRGPEGTFNTAKLKYNSHKNRYTDVLCYDHSRVMLSLHDGDPSSDYINANYVDGYKQKNAFISTQGPLPKTFGDFWRMIWEQSTVCVVMTTRTVERGRPKCGQYWPLQEEEEMTCGDIHLVNLGSEQSEDCIHTVLHLANLKTRETRTVAHLQFTSWPDYGVPHSAGAMLEFLVRMREAQSSLTAALGDTWAGHPLGPPIVVHCSAGIGRTGTLCTLDICLRRLEEVGTVDVQSTVEKIRSQRAHSIQMPDQYVFCHLAILEAALGAGLLDGVDLANFEDDVSESE